MPDVAVTEAHKNYCSYAHELNGPTFNSLQEFKHGKWLQGGLWKTTKLSKLGGGCLRGNGCMLAQDNTI